MTKLRILDVAREALEYVNLEDTLHQTEGSIAEHLLATAKDLWKHKDAVGKNGLPDALNAWLGQMSMAEKVAKSQPSETIIYEDLQGREELKGFGLEAMPRAWIQAKSDIKAAWKAGAVLANFKTYLALKKHKVDLNKGGTEAAKQETIKAVKATSKNAKTVKITALPADVQALIGAITVQAEALFIEYTKKLKNEDELAILLEAQTKFVERLTGDFVTTKNALEKIAKKVLPVTPTAPVKATNKPDDAADAVIAQ